MIKVTHDDSISMNHKYGYYYFLYFLQVDSIDKLTSLITELKDYIPVSERPKLCERNKKIEEFFTTKHIQKCSTPSYSRAFMCYEKNLLLPRMNVKKNQN